MGKSHGKHYALIALGGALGGVLLYHVLGKQIEGVWGNIPYLKDVKSNFAVQNYQSEI